MSLATSGRVSRKRSIEDGFGYAPVQTQNQAMRSNKDTHIPFARLPIEDRALFYFQSMVAMEYHCYLPHTAVEVFADLERIWNAARLTPEDLRDWHRMSGLLESELAKCVQQQRHSTRPKAKLRGRRAK
jgi:hypothetical protein